jgi:hypothetical protein
MTRTLLALIFATATLLGPRFCACASVAAEPAETCVVTPHCPCCPVESPSPQHREKPSLPCPCQVGVVHDSVPVPPTVQVVDCSLVSLLPLTEPLAPLLEIGRESVRQIDPAPLDVRRLCHLMRC